MSVTAEQVLADLNSIFTQDIVDDRDSYESENENIDWYDVGEILRIGPTKYILDANETYGYRVEQQPVPVFDGYTIAEVDSYGGEGQGDSLWVVFEVTNDDGTKQHFRKDGYYTSYDGSSWDGKFREVYPKVVQKTVYN